MISSLITHTLATLVGIAIGRWAPKLVDMWLARGIAKARDLTKTNDNAAGGRKDE